MGGEVPDAKPTIAELPFLTHAAFLSLELFGLDFDSANVDADEDDEADAEEEETVLEPPATELYDADDADACVCLF